MLIKLLSTLDIFPSNVHLYLKSSNKYRTATGAFFTLALIGITLAQAIAVLTGIFDHQTPQVVMQKEYNRFPGDLGLNSSNFVFALKVQDPFYNLSRSYVSFTLTLVKITRNPDSTRTFKGQTIPLKKCDKEYMKGFELEYDTLGLSTALCPTVDSYAIQGTFLNDQFDFMLINATSCKNDSRQPDIICQSPENIAKAVNGKNIQLQLFFSNTIITTSNYTNPVSRFIHETYWSTIPNVTTVGAEILINQQDIIDDDDLWVGGRNKNTQTTYQIDLTEQRINIEPLERVDSETFLLMSLLIKRSNYLYTTTRTYTKVVTGLSSIGGIYSLLLGVFGILVTLYTRKAYLVDVANELYEFDIPEKHQKGKQQCCWKRKRDQNAINRTPSRMDTRRVPLSLSEKLERFSLHFSGATKRKLHYDFKDFILGMLCCMRREKDKLVERAFQTVSRDIDVLHLIKSLQHAEKLKKVLLTPEQEVMLSYSRPPLIKMETNEESKSLEEKPNSAGEKLNLVETKIKKPRRKSRIFRKKRKAQLFEDNEEEGSQGKYKSNHMNKFMSLSQSYQNLFKETQNPINYRILKFLDDELQEVLYDINLEVHNNTETAHEYGIIVRRAPRLTDKTVYLQNKFSAAVLIAKRLAQGYRNRKKTTSWRLKKNNESHLGISQQKEEEPRNNMANPIQITLELTEMPTKRQSKVNQTDEGKELSMTDSLAYLDPSRPYTMLYQSSPEKETSPCRSFFADN